MIKKWNFLLVFLCLFTTACTEHIMMHSFPVPVNSNALFAVIPFSNYTETPLAGERAMAITAALMESRGLRRVIVYQKQDSSNAVLPGMNKVASRAALLQWARHAHAQYVMTGSVTEWTYKVGLDGEPVVGISLQLIELPSKRIIWTSVGSVSGGSRVAVSTEAQKLINSMLTGFLKSGYVHA